MEKFNSSKHIGLLASLPFSYFSTAIYADFCEFITERNGERLIVWRDIFYPEEYPCIFPPQQESNWEDCAVTFTTEDFINNIKEKGIEIIVQKSVGTEFFYNTEAFVTPHGSIKQDADLFKRLYPQHEIRETCDTETITKFYEEWRGRKERGGEIFQEAEAFFDFCLHNLEKYGIQQIYVFIDGKLAGLAWGVAHPSGNWVGLHLKIDYAYKGLSRYLHHLRACRFKDRATFSLGTEAAEAGIERYKRDLHPSREVPYFYVLTGEKR